MVRHLKPLLFVLRPFRRSVHTLWLLVAAVLLTAPLAAQTAPVFPVTPFTTTSVEPSVFATADLNGDGLPDIASVTFNSLNNPSSTVVSILLATSNPGTYSLSTLPALPCLLSSNIVAADLNKDGKQDLTLGCGGYVVVLLGNGDGTFSGPGYYGVASPTALGVADLSGNGYPDIVAINNGVLTVLVNRGASSPGSFTTGGSYPAGNGGPLLTGDFNGDGKVDLAIKGTANWGIFYGNGDGTLQTLRATAASGQAVASDFNHDGITDLAYGTTDSTGRVTNIQTLLGSSSGLVSGPLSTLPYVTPGGPLSLAGSTGGGQFVNLAYSSGPLSILLGDGRGGFSLGQSYVISGSVQPQTTATGATNLVVLANSLGYTVLTGNGDGTFQGIHAQPVPANSYFVAADINNDGLTDVISDAPGGALLSLLSRGDGAFLPVSSTPGLSTQILVPGDFNSDGKMDVVGIQPGFEEIPKGDLADPQIFFFSGNGDGNFNAGSTVPSLMGVQFTNGVSGDFNGDGKLDLLLSYFSVLPNTCGLIFLAGNGNGTFGNPITISQSCSSQGGGPLLVGDLNGDGKLDAIYSADVYLGSGLGAFQQQPLGITGAQALGDLNGDGKLDIVVPVDSGSTVSLYAGRGDGTFQSTPFYTGPTSSCNGVYSSASAIGNASGPSPDFAVFCPTTEAFIQVDLYLGNGSSAFLPDSNQYVLGNLPTGLSSAFATFARLNGNSTALASDQYQDYLGISTNSVIALLNTHTAPPVFTTTSTLLTVTPAIATYGTPETFTATVTPSTATGMVNFMNGSVSLGTAPLTGSTAVLTTSTIPAGTYAVVAAFGGKGSYLPSSSVAASLSVAKAATTTTLTVSPQSAQTVTFTANVGIGATGTVTFTVGSTTLPAVTIANGTASEQDSSLAAGTYNVDAAYSGDANHLGSSSLTASITVVAADFNTSVNPTALTVTRGQSAQAAFTITPVGGYSGSVTFSCGSVPPEASCTFNPATVTLSGTATGLSTLFLKTTAPVSALRSPSSSRLFEGLALASALSMLWPARRRRLACRLLSILCLITIAGCGGNSQSLSTDPGTPVGTQSITIQVAGSSNTHTVTLPITIQ